MSNTNEQIEKKDNNKEVVIDIIDLNKSFGGLDVLKNISLQLFKEENLVVLGKSGTGKSVLIKCIAALIKPESGSIQVLGENIVETDKKALTELRKKIGFMFQGGALYDSMTVKENLEFPLKRIKKEMSNEEMQSKIDEALENVGLKDTKDKMPSELSGGMRKRISMARTIVLDPQIMLYDEPTSGLDPVTSSEIADLILEIRDKYKTSSIIITHDIPCAKSVADRVIMLKEGSIFEEGTYEEFANSDKDEIKAFFKQ